MFIYEENNYNKNLLKILGFFIPQKIQVPTQYTVQKKFRLTLKNENVEQKKSDNLHDLDIYMYNLKI